jgi:hypothetical protein
MTDPADSIVSSTRPSPLRTVAAVLALVGVTGAAVWLLTRGKGADDDPARVLIVGPTPELSDFLERKGFDVSHLSLGEAIGEGQAFDSSLDDLPAMLEYADQAGFGYLALNLAHGERYDFSTIDQDAGEPPPGTTFAVVSVGDLGTSVSYGGVVPEVLHEPPAGEQVGLLLALFGQAEIAKARTRDGSNDLLIRFGAADTIEDVVAYEKAQASMSRQIAAWHALAERERAANKPIELAGPYERLRGWPLANGSLLLAGGRDAWRSPDGISSKWVGDDLEAALSVVTLDAPAQRIPCAALPETLSLDGGFAVAPAGDALLIPSDAWVADLWVLTGAACSFEKRDQIRRLDGGELGHPRASGRTAASGGGRLMWANAKMQSYHAIAIDGVELRPGEMHWIGDDLVVVPAKIDFVVAAQARLDRMALAADPTGATMPAEVDPAMQPHPTEALVFVELPSPTETDEVRIAVVPMPALLTKSTDVRATLIHTLHPLAGKPGSVAAVVDTSAGPVLVRAAIDPEKSATNALAIDYDLTAASALSSSTIELEQLATLPAQIREFAVSPDAGHIAWTLDEEIMLLPLGVTDGAPTRLTDNDRSDSHPRFVGAYLVFDSSYTAADELPSIEAVRALAVPASR